MEQIMFGHFNNDTTTETDSETDADAINNTMVNEYVHVIVEEEKEFEYTEHVAEISFRDGLKKNITFDALSQKDGVFVFKNYRDSLRLHRSRRCRPAKTRAFLSVPEGAVEYVETKERRQRTITDTVKLKQKERRPVAERMVRNGNALRIVEDE
jgi:hypothetical protein